MIVFRDGSTATAQQVQPFPFHYAPNAAWALYVPDHDAKRFAAAFVADLSSGWKEKLLSQGDLYWLQWTALAFLATCMQQFLDDGDDFVPPTDYCTVGIGPKAHDEHGDEVNFGAEWSGAALAVDYRLLDSASDERTLWLAREAITPEAVVEVRKMADALPGRPA